MNVLPEVLKAVGFENTESKSITATTCGGICITLHNKGERPTRYTVTPNAKQRKDSYFGKGYTLYTYTLDTLINKDKERHEMLKINFPSINQGDDNFSNMVNIIRRLIAQNCNGTKEETLSIFTPMGLLFWGSVK